MKSSKDIHDLFPGFLSGTLTPPELVRLFQHFGKTDESEIRLLIQKEMEFGSGEDEEFVPNSRLDAIYDKIDMRIMAKVSSERITRQMSFPVLLRYAASVLLALGLIWLLADKFRPFADNTSWNKVSTRYERKKILLPDGSQVWLGPQSSLEHPQQFSGNSRPVKLDGEAFFEVTRDVNRPFTIQSGKLTTRVLGTSFNINAYKNEKSASVTVLTGKVSVSTGPDSKEEVNLLPFQQALLQDDGQGILRREYPGASDLLRRRDGNIRYDGASLTDIIRDIQKVSVHQIVAKGDFSKCLFYGEMKPGDSPLEFLQNVCLVNNLTLKKQNETLVTITGKGCGK